MTASLYQCGPPPVTWSIGATLPTVRSSAILGCTSMDAKVPSGLSVCNALASGSTTSQRATFSDDSAQGAWHPHATYSARRAVYPRQKAGISRTSTVNSSSRPSSMPKRAAIWRCPAAVAKLPAGPMIGPSPGPTLASAVAAPLTGGHEVEAEHGQQRASAPLSDRQNMKKKAITAIDDVVGERPAIEGARRTRRAGASAGRIWSLGDRVAARRSGRS